MQISDIKKIVVLGAGTMGSGIAHVCAAAGYKTLLFDVQPNTLSRAIDRIAANLDEAIRRNKSTEAQKQTTLGNIETSYFFDDLKGELVIEAIVEDLDIKLEALGRVAAINPPDTILASNTSSIPITRLAAHLPQPERVVGMHFFNPAHLMKLVEIVAGLASNPQTIKTTSELAEKLGKTPVETQDSPGFIVNRVARPYYVEALQIAEESIADYAIIDELAEASGFKMGPFRLMDLIGIDVNFSVTHSIYQSFHQIPRFRPSRLQQQKVEGGYHGRKTGKGFYEYNAE